MTDDNPMCTCGHRKSSHFDGSCARISDDPRGGPCECSGFAEPGSSHVVPTNEHVIILGQCTKCYREFEYDRAERWDAPLCPRCLSENLKNFTFANWRK